MSDHICTCHLGNATKTTHIDENGNEMGYELEGDFGYVYDEEENSVNCPHCGNDEIVYSAASFFCPDCESEFDESTLEQWVDGDIYIS